MENNKFVEILPNLEINKDTLNVIIDKAIYTQNTIFFENYHYINIRGTKEQMEKFKELINSKDIVWSPKNIPKEFDNLKNKYNGIFSAFKSYLGVNIRFEVND